MPSGKPQLSITLPRNFTFHYTDGQLPKTPEPENRPRPEPPQLPKQMLRVRRRRPHRSDIVFPEPAMAGADVPIPTIEATEVCSQPSAPQAFMSEGEPSRGLLAPTHARRVFSPPKTPLGQIGTPMETAIAYRNNWEDDRFASAGESISRPSSSCSGFSDSSVSSRGTLDSLRSYGGSCTSPESDVSDPFTFLNASQKMPELASPLRERAPNPNKRFKIRNASSLTPEMDEHLWVTYIKYVQDPTVTPFKMLPGTAPPLGVCHRVVREAKRTWKGGKPLVPGRAQSSVKSGSPDTIKASGSGSCTPTGSDPRKSYPPWPRSESSVRRRLRELCKRKPHLSAHYSRLLQSRSPSPFQSSPNHHLGAQHSDHASFGPSEGHDNFSRDLGLSLATSTSATMQYGNPLSQLAAEEETPRPQRQAQFAQPMTGRSPAHQKSQSLQFGLGLGGLESHPQARQLGSSFFPEFVGQAQNAVNHPPSFGVQGPDAGGPVVLGPPLELHAPAPLPRSFKRRAQFHLDDAPPGLRQDLLHELFGAPAESSHRRVRSRGFSLGDMGEGARNRSLSSIFTPPSAEAEDDDANGTDAPTDQPLPQIVANDMSADYLMPPQTQPGEQIRRLGSPFSPKGFSNTFPRSFSGHHNLEPPVSFEERLGAFGHKY
ncbi:hypothetical protein BDY21DRAFT_363939 [Lineolata rhizophorae]|uniref:Uncharacterized protein n=1 Tax=Lineolata rhizophorae TaxID=578093 RepID=A0A6A6P1K6_9PEZI|nr:hypothetical protein BDY21DRAFT_363939 [Lineolata rhizophorae]